MQLQFPVEDILKEVQGNNSCTCANCDKRCKLFIYAIMSTSAYEGSDKNLILTRLVYLFAECRNFTIEKRNKTQRTTKKTLNATSENEIVSTSKEVPMMNVAITVNRQGNK